MITPPPYPHTTLRAVSSPPYPYPPTLLPSTPPPPFFCLDFLYPYVLVRYILFVLPNKQLSFCFVLFCLFFSLFYSRLYSNPLLSLSARKQKKSKNKTNKQTNKVKQRKTDKRKTKPPPKTILQLYKNKKSKQHTRKINQSTQPTRKKRARAPPRQRPRSQPIPYLGATIEPMQHSATFSFPSASPSHSLSFIPSRSTSTCKPLSGLTPHTACSQLNQKQVRTPLPHPSPFPLPATPIFFPAPPFECVVLYPPVRVPLAENIERIIAAA